MRDAEDYLSQVEVVRECRRAVLQQRAQVERAEDDLRRLEAALRNAEEALRFEIEGDIGMPMLVTDEDGHLQPNVPSAVAA